MVTNKVKTLLLTDIHTSLMVETNLPLYSYGFQPIFYFDLLDVHVYIKSQCVCYTCICISNTKSLEILSGKWSYV